MTPYAQEQLVRLGTWIPSFARAGELLEALTGVHVAEASVRRRTEAAGAAQVRLQEQEMERLKREGVAEAQGPQKVLLSVDGALVPLVGREWAEVKTLVVGEVQPTPPQGAGRGVRTEKLSYFSRLAEAERFRWQALVETHRRGVSTAVEAASVSDGAEWIQGFVCFHRPDAVRILDLPHAAEHVNAIGQAIYGQDTSEARAWFQEQVEQLKTQGPGPVLSTLRALGNAHPHLATLPEHLAYLEKHEAQMHYPDYQAAGWPIGSGCVESANKLVVEDRLKGSGMHWARGHVNPLLALRNVVCNDRWDEAWGQIALSLRHQAWQQRLQRQQTRRAEHAPGQAEEAAAVAAPPLPAPCAPQVAPTAPPPKPAGPRRPAANHPWRHAPIGKARYRPWKPCEPPKL
ncbi:MAG: ISKra4 family transposase [Actinobacteria bacterium]|nr:ISKra4 family transposase [Actinomycetota bacterium]